MIQRRLRLSNKRESLISKSAIKNLPEDIRKSFEFASSPVLPISGISVVIPIRGKDREINLMKCLSKILLQNVEPMEIIISEEDSHERIKLRGYSRDKRIRKVFTKGDVDKFNKSIAINAGVMASTYSKILMNDADIVPPQGYLHRVSEILNEFDSCFLGKEIYNVFLSIVDGSVSCRGTKRTDYFSGGSIAFTKEAFIRIGGMCERFSGYGSEDCEFWGRITSLTKMFESRDLALLHLNHRRTCTYSQNAELYDEVMSMPIESRLSSLREDLDKRSQGVR